MLPLYSVPAEVELDELVQGPRRGQLLDVVLRQIQSNQRQWGSQRNSIQSIVRQIECLNTVVAGVDDRLRGGRRQLQMREFDLPEEDKVKMSYK